MPEDSFRRESTVDLQIYDFPYPRKTRIGLDNSQGISNLIAIAAVGLMTIA